MLTIRSTHEILNNPWNDISPSTIVPSQQPKPYEKNLTFEEVVMWEEIFYEGGNIGVYAAWSPYSNFYLITYNLFLNTEYKFEKFVGENAAQECYDRLSELGIHLKYS